MERHRWLSRGSSGRLGAFEGADGDPQGSTADIVVASLSSGRILKDVADGNGPGGSGTGGTTSLVLKPDGAVAWIVSFFANNMNVQQVYADDASGYRLIASSAAIAPNSLALAGSTIYWLQAGAAQSATLR